MNMVVFNDILRTLDKANSAKKRYLCTIKFLDFYFSYNGVEVKGIEV